MEHTAETSQSQADEEPACCVDKPSVIIKPAWTAWREALSTKRESSARSQLGLDTHRPIVMSGHQPVVFHSGILAKLIALDEAAKRSDAQAVWIVPDQDAVDLGRIRVPIGNGPELSVDVIDLLSENAMIQGAPVGSVAAAEIDQQDHELLKPLVEYLDQYAGVESVAQQFAYATIEYACELLGIRPPRVIFVSELFGADTLSQIIESMRQDPMSCALSYNESAARHPEAGVRELIIEGDRVELPLWGCRFGEVRVAIDTSNLHLFTEDELLPRGLLMSAIARAYLSDLFIHGTGGWVYDRISEDWFNEWLGITLSPMAMVTATNRLDLGFQAGEVIDPTYAKWKSHHAKHTPEMVGGHGDQQRKDELITQIKDIKRKDPQRAVLYRQLQELLVVFRKEHEREIAQIAQQANQAVELARQYELARDRTWAFVFFDQQSIDVLDHATRSMMS